MRLYAYCLSDELDGAAVEGLAGVGGAPVRLHACGSLSAVVSEFGGERAAVERESLRAHNRVNAHVLARATPLPFRFGTLSDAKGLERYVEANGAALIEALARVRGCVEMGVKLRMAVEAKAEECGPEADVGRAPASSTDVERASSSSGAGGRGTAFLLAKRREILCGEGLKSRAERAAARLSSAVGGLAREADVRLSPEGPIVVRAAHLVERADVEEYRARVRAFGAGVEGMQVLASGPWPPYSFGLARA